MVPDLELLLEPRDSVGGGLCVGAALGLDTMMTVGPALGVFMVTNDDTGYGTGEGTQYGINVCADKENTLG